MIDKNKNRKANLNTIQSVSIQYITKNSILLVKLYNEQRKLECFFKVL